MYIMYIYRNKISTRFLRTYFKTLVMISSQRLHWFLLQHNYLYQYDRNIARHSKTIADRKFGAFLFASMDDCFATGGDGNSYIDRIQLIWFYCKLLYIFFEHLWAILSICKCLLLTYKLNSVLYGWKLDMSTCNEILVYVILLLLPFVWFIYYVHDDNFTYNS